MGIDPSNDKMHASRINLDLNDRSALQTRIDSDSVADRMRRLRRITNELE